MKQKNGNNYFWLPTGAFWEFKVLVGPQKDSHVAATFYREDYPLWLALILETKRVDDATCVTARNSRAPSSHGGPDYTERKPGVRTIKSKSSQRSHMPGAFKTCGRSKNVRASVILRSQSPPAFLLPSDPHPINSQR